MESKAEYKLRLRTELNQVGSEIDKLIVRTDKVAAAVKQGYDYIEAAILDKQELAQEKQLESSMSGCEVWDLIWDNVWDAVKEFNNKAAAEVKQDYKELEPALHAKQTVLQEQLHVSGMSGDEVWDEVWNEVWIEVWGVAKEFNRRAAMEIRHISDKLKALFVKQAELKARLHELLVAGDEAWNVFKEISNAIVK